MRCRNASGNFIYGRIAAEKPQEIKGLPRIGQSGSVQGPAGNVAAEGQRKVKIGQKIQHYITHPLFAGKREPPSIEPSEKNGPSTQSQGFENIGTAANASVKKHGNPSVHCAHDGGESVERGNGAVDLPATMIRDNYAVNARVDCVLRIVRMQNALQNNRQRRVLAEERYVAPGEGGVRIQVAPKLNRGGRILLRRLRKKRTKNGVAEVIGETLAQYKRQIGML